MAGTRKASSASQTSLRTSEELKSNKLVTVVGSDEFRWFLHCKMGDSCCIRHCINGMHFPGVLCAFGQVADVIL